MAGIDLVKLTKNIVFAILACMAKSTNSLYEAKTQLSALVERAAAGEEIVITKHGKPMAKLVAYRPKKAPKRKPGGWEGKIWMAPDFTEPLPEELWNVLSGGSNESAP